MNLNILSALVAVSLKQKQEPMLGTITTLINEALNQIQQRRSWNCMKLSIPFNLNVSGPGPFTFALPSTYKELQSGPNSLYATDGTPYGNSIWRIFTQQEVFRLTQIGVNVAERTAYMNQDTTGIWTIYFPGPMDEGSLPPDTSFTVDTYSYLAPVSAPTDENDLMRRYPMLVLEFCKFLVFSLGSDPDSIAMKQEASRMIEGGPGWTGYFKQASYDDLSHQMRGKTTRMDGY
jgi:hypothetical protein